MTTYHYIAFSMFGVLVLIDHFGRGHRLAEVPHWRLLGTVSMLSYFAILTYAPLLWDSLLGQYRIIPADQLPLWLQVLGGLFFYELGVYWWHRTMHASDWLWRHTHQLHHSAERVDIWGAFWFHPLDSAAWALLGSLALVWLFGVSAEVGLIINVLGTFPAMFQHLNIRTPQWVGYFLQRPESHSIHHQRGVHAYNYGDLPIFDILFGTFRNPKEWQEEAGFHEGSTRQIGEMLTFRKIS
jgi:sterol desaturase/sphingolipid hydroxylase (fatty acid hydroxylase superfamily)